MLAKQVLDDRRGRTEVSAYWRRLLRNPAEHTAFLNACAEAAGVATFQYSDVETLLRFRSNEVARKPSALKQQATLLRKQISDLASEPVEESAAPEPVADEGCLAVDAADAAAAKKRAVKTDGRTLRIVSELGLERLEPLPELAAICPERAGAAVSAWRKRSGDRTGPPPVELVQRLIHADHWPTAIGATNDHYFLLVHGRWASPAELLRLFSVHQTATARPALERCEGMTARQMVEAYGRTIHPTTAQEALATAMEESAAWAELRAEGTPPRYMSAFSGLDMPTVAMDVLAPDWVHAGAAECCKHMRRFLVNAYAARGLRPEDIAHDAESHEACAGREQGPDVWISGAPCGAWSPANRSATEPERREQTVQARRESARQLIAALECPRVWRPAIVMVESVDAKCNRLAIDAAMRTLGPAYRVTSRVYRAKGRMKRVRRVWTATR